MPQTIRILLTGAGSPAASGVMKSLRLSHQFRFHVICVDCNPLTAGVHLADQYIVGPRASDDVFIPFILQICRKENIDIIFSIVTEELIKLSTVQDKLAEIGTSILISSVQTLTAVINKGTLYAELRNRGMETPQFRVVHSPAELIAAIHELGYPNQPVCFKPTVTDGSRGFHILDPGIDLSRLLFYEKTDSAYLSEAELLRVVGGDAAIPELIVMEYLPFEEYSVDMLADEGNVVVAVPRLREATAAGISVKSRIVNEPDIVEYASAVAKLLKLNGIVGIQVKRDIHRQPKIVEINPRIQGTIVHCTAAGINFPLLAVKQVLGIVPAKEELTVKWNTRMVRYWEEVFFDEQGSSFVIG